MRRGPRVVFVPGFMQRGDAWRAVAERLPERYPSRLVDHETWTLEERIAEIEAACEAGDVLVGYSLGGRVALRFALHRPGVLSGLVVVGAHGGIEREDERAARARADEELAAWMESASIEEVVERWESLPVFSTQRSSLVAAQRPGRLSHEPHLLARLLRSCGQGAMKPVWGQLGALDVPLLAVAGALDEGYVVAARRLAAEAVRGEAVVIPGAGHAPQLERPDLVAAALVEFVGGVG